jgi:N-acetylneuraminate synthase
MTRTITFGNHQIGEGHPVYIVAEIGINHNGDLETAKRLIDVAKAAGCDAVKFQKRTPELCVPAEQRDLKRDTPWGIMTYLEYRHRVEFGEEQYAQIDRYCKERGIDWFASCWDEPSVEFIEQFKPIGYKIASASLTDQSLLKRINATGRPMILSTGMSTMDEIRSAFAALDRDRLVLCHTTSAYPCKPEELNLRMIQTLMKEFACPVGYSGHEVGLQVTYAAVAMGACMVERHITLDRAMWGTDQAASIEPQGLIRLVRDIRVIEKSLGTGEKKVYESEKPIRAKLRRSEAVAPDAIERIQIVQTNNRLKDRHTGQRCFILATGPSIKQQPVRQLAGEHCIAVSNFFVHPDYRTIRPRYHCIAPFHAPITEEGWQDWLKEAAANTGDATMFFGLRDLQRNTRDGNFASREKFFLNFAGSTEQIETHGVDLTRILPPPQSVTIMALYGALYMGFTEIYLLGCDHDWILHLNASTHFYDESQHALNRGGYNEWFAPGLDTYFRDYLSLWKQYKVLRDIADRRGVRIINATKGGLLDVFPRANFESLLVQRAA